MKGALACFAEAVRGLGSFPGEVVIVAVGLHESPLGRGQDLTYLLGGTASRPTSASSASSARRRCRSRTSAARPSIAIRRGARSRELMTAAGTRTDPRRRPGDRGDRAPTRLAAVEHEWIGPSRTSSARCTAATSTTAIRSSAGSSARAAGRREHGGGGRGRVRRAAQPIAAESGCTIELDLQVSRGAYRIEPEHRLVLALQDLPRGHG